MKRAIFAFLVVAISMGLLVSGCGSKDGAGGTKDGAGGKKGVGGGKKKWNLAFLTINAANYWTIARRGCEQAEKDLGTFTFDFRIPSEATAAEQKRVLDDLLARGVDGIAISPVDPANQTDMLNAAAAKTLLITLDSDAPQSKRVCYIGTDNVAAGVQAGEMIKEALPKGGKIMVFVGKKDAQNAKERFAGIEKAIKGTQIEVIDIRTDDTDGVRAKANVIDTLTQYPDIACLVGLWSYNGPAILNAAREAGKAGKVKIVCFDEEEETLTGVASGEIHATIVQQPYEFGYQGMKLMVDYLNGDKSVVPASGKHIVPTMIVKKDDVGAFKKRLDALLK